VGGGAGGVQAEALSKAGGGLRAQLILVGVNGKNVEGMPAAAAIALVGAEKRLVPPPVPTGHFSSLLPY
jgi:hypothetical protein